MKNTFLPTKNLLNEKTWYLIDAENKTLGRVATQISQILIGKHKYDYSYHLDTGDYVVVINAEKIIVSGQKEKMKKSPVTDLIPVQAIRVQAVGVQDCQPATPSV